MTSPSEKESAIEKENLKTGSFRSYRFRSGGAAGRVAQKLQYAASVVLAEDRGSVSSVSLGVLEEAVSHFLRELGLGAVRKGSASSGDSGSARTRGSTVRSYRDSPGWVRDEEARLRIQSRLRKALAHDAIEVMEVI